MCYDGKPAGKTNRSTDRGDNSCKDPALAISMTMIFAAKNTATDGDVNAIDKYAVLILR